jgi:hypothetical protein
MMRRFVVIALAALVSSCSSSAPGPEPIPIPAQPAAQPPAQPPVQPAPTQTAPAPGATQPPATAAAPADTNPESNPVVQQLMRTIAGHEQEPAGQVFKNVQVLKTEPAGDFVRRMGGFARALGGRCSRCHVTGDWPADTKQEKAVAREMIDMVNGINARLQRIQGVRSNTKIGCNTCHRGMARPAP